MGSDKMGIGAAESFASILGLVPPWVVAGVQPDISRRRILVAVDFGRGGRFKCAACGFDDSRAHDAAPSVWVVRGDLAGWSLVLHARIPRAKCTQCGRVRRVAVPWGGLAKRERSMK